VLENVPGQWMGHKSLKKKNQYRNEGGGAGKLKDVGKQKKGAQKTAPAPSKREDENSFKPKGNCPEKTKRGSTCEKGSSRYDFPKKPIKSCFSAIEKKKTQKARSMEGENSRKSVAKKKETFKLLLVKSANEHPLWGKGRLK